MKQQITKPGARPALLVFKQFVMNRCYESEWKQSKESALSSKSNLQSKIRKNCTMHNTFQSFLFWKALKGIKNVKYIYN